MNNLVHAVAGGRAGHTVTAVESAGCYAPGGRYPLPSSVLMTVITARVAGMLLGERRRERGRARGER